MGLGTLTAQTNKPATESSKGSRLNLFPATRVIPLSKIPPINGRKSRSASILTIAIPEPTDPLNLVIEPPIPRLEEPSDSGVLEFFPFEEPVPESKPPSKPEVSPPPAPLARKPTPPPSTPKPRTFQTDPDYQIKLSSNELKARSRFLRWIGGEDALGKKEADISAARTAAAEALEKHDLNFSKISQIAIIDFTKPSYLRRMTLYDPKTGRATKHLVAHGVNSGKSYAKNFSNRLGSNKSSKGLYWVGDQYTGKHGRSLRLHGMDKGVNDLAFKRAIVLHAAWYVSYSSMSSNLTKEKMPRIGRSKGCPAVHQSDLNYVLNKLKKGTFLYIYAG